ncbi:ATP-binding protein [Kitasatospora sp. NPDC085879]|uniref:ATP-binding protein n=1 Tax=Kitasatospora sp. NPDC085879 TaxID=3154769 RepID=UPI0034144D79
MMWIARFPGVPESVRDARRMVREALEPLAQAEDAVLIVSELVTNAVVHSRSGAGGFLWVEIRRGHGAVRVAVTDEGTSDGDPAHRPADGGDFGRGLRIVNALAEHWGATGEANGRRTVWAELAPARMDGARAVRQQGHPSPAAEDAPAEHGRAPAHRAAGAVAQVNAQAVAQVNAQAVAVPAALRPGSRCCRLCGAPLPPRQGAAVTARR